MSRYNVLTRTRVFGVLKFGLANKGLIQPVNQFEANVILVSWASSAEFQLKTKRKMNSRILTHVWSYEHPLRKVIIFYVLIEKREIFDVGTAR